MVDTSARSRLQICALCTAPARYKCPQCATHTCSLPCSRKHKQDIGCTGERDKVQYVPMNAYGWGTMMRDYCYLEDIGRKVSDWGNEIIRGGYMDNHRASKAASASKSLGRKQTTGKPKRDLLRDHLETLGIDVELLPAGMERKNLNQSTLDQKSKCPLLTIELIFYPPTTLASFSSSLPPSYKTLSHRNSLSLTLLTVLQRQVSSTLSKSQKQKDSTPDWVPSIVTPHPEAPECFVPPHCYIRANTEFPKHSDTAYYHKLDPTLSLAELLQGTSFIEFPTIHVFDPDASSFCCTVINKSGSIVQVTDEDQVNVARGVKRKRLDKMVGLKAIFGMVGGYGSESGSLSDEETADKNLPGLAILDVYSESDDAHNSGVENDQSDDGALAGDNQLGLDPPGLLEIVKQAQSAADEDILDWGDDWDIDTEERASSVDISYL